LTPAKLNDDENKRPSSSRNHSNKNELSSNKKEKKSSTPIKSQVQYRILQRGQPDEPSPILKKPQLKNEFDTSENSPTTKCQRNRRRVDRRLNNDTNQKQQSPQQPFSNLTNNNTTNGLNSHTFRYGGPRCWTQFRLNRSEVSRCLRE
ncbi:unnamed protein product, partial [Rotaria socialis]